MQIFHDFDRALTNESIEFINKNLKNAKSFEYDADIIRFASDSVCLKGAFIECGVATGRTINFIAGLNPSKRIYGFDSFEGLNENWEFSEKETFFKSSFGLRNKIESKLPIIILKNTCIFKGYFNEVLPKYKKQFLKEEPIAFLHVDCDLYRPTKEIFEALGQNICSGTIILFDELYNYENYKNHEYKAFMEYVVNLGKALNISLIARMGLVLQ